MCTGRREPGTPSLRSYHPQKDLKGGRDHPTLTEGRGDPGKEGEVQRPWGRNQPEQARCGCALGSIGGAKGLRKKE